MNWSSFWQVFFGFWAFVVAIAFFNQIGLDTNFIITFVLSIFAIAISIFFFSESNKISNIIMDKLSGIKEDGEGMKSFLDILYRKIDKVQYPNTNEDKYLDKKIKEYDVI